MNVPKLRFKEFTDEWKIINLDELYEFKNGINADRTAYGKGVPLISVTDIINNNFITYNKIRGKIDIGNNILMNNSVEYGDILFQRSSETFVEIGTSNIYLDNKMVTFGGFVIRGKKKNNEIPLFINYELKSPNSRKKIIIKGAGAQHYNIGQEDLKQVSIFIPSKEEQTKIANFLSLLDKKIELQTKKIEDLKLYKKGLVSTLKSKNLNWNNYKISELFTVTRGVVIPKNELKECIDEEYKYPVYSSQTSNNGILGYDNKYDFEGKYLTWTTDGANAGKVFYRRGKFRCTNVCGILYNNENEYVDELTAELLNYITPKHVSYVGNPKLMNNVMANINIQLPNISESNKISNILNMINTKIDKENNKLISLQKLKKGLMQNMFV